MLTTQYEVRKIYSITTQFLFFLLLWPYYSLRVFAATTISCHLSHFWTIFFQFSSPSSFRFYTTLLLIYLLILPTIFFCVYHVVFSLDVSIHTLLLMAIKFATHDMTKSLNLLGFNKTIYWSHSIIFCSSQLYLLRQFPVSVSNTDPTVFFDTLFSKVFSFLFMVLDNVQASHAYVQFGLIIAVYNLLFVLLDSILELRNFANA